ncbi:hypothetical protein FACS1894207_3210 [Bacteroidia bacterium]|nr:hypothetical protein FACS1894207_3210 [Bacteroidia bacterium]
MLSVSFTNTKKRIETAVGDFLKEYGFHFEPIFVLDKTLKGFVRKDKYSNKQIFTCAFINYRERLKPAKQEFQDEFEKIVSMVTQPSFSLKVDIDFPKLLTK